MELDIYVDGGSRGNPGEGAVGVVIKQKVKKGQLGQAKEKILEKFGKKIGVTTNNKAEYRAVIAALEWVKKRIEDKINKLNPPIRKVNVYLDSKLVYNQLRGFYKMKNPQLRELLFKTKIIEQEIKISLSYFLIPREKNRETDREVNKALDYKEFRS